MTAGHRVRRLDPDDEPRLRRFHEVLRRAEEEDGRPWNVFWSYAEVAERLRTELGDRHNTAWTLDEGDEIVAAGIVELPLLDNLDLGFVFAAVEPERRGRGLGGQLLESLVDRVREAGRARALGMTAVPVEERETASVLRFAAAHGFVQGNLEVYRVLRLPVRAGLLDELADRAAERHAGYTIETYADEVPSRLLASYCHLINQLAADAPSGDIAFEEERLTPEILERKLERDRRSGRELLFTFAVDGQGEAVAHSDLSARTGDPVAFQMGTLVRRDHRGHRLGTTVKAANLRALQEARPDVTEVHTQNAETNRWMVDINIALGFEVVGLCPDLERRL